MSVVGSTMNVTQITGNRASRKRARSWQELLKWQEEHPTLTLHPNGDQSHVRVRYGGIMIDWYSTKAQWLSPMTGKRGFGMDRMMMQLGAIPHSHLET